MTTSPVYQILDPNLSKVASIPHGAVERRAHRGQDVLLDDDPAVVAGTLEIPEQCGKLDRPLPQLAEQAMPECRLVVPLLGTRAAGDTWLAILEVNVPD